jgi:hypothetical protein
MNKKITVAHLITLVGGVVAFLFSFFNFFKYGGDGTSAWGDGLFPVATIAAILGLVAALLMINQLTGAVKLPGKVLTFDWKQITFTWGVVATAITLGYLVMDKGGYDDGIGLIFMLLGSIAVLVGSTMDLLGKGTNTVDFGNMGGSHQHAAGQSSPPPPPPPPAS